MRQKNAGTEARDKRGRPTQTSNSILERICAPTKFDVQDGFVAAEKWRLLESDPFEAPVAVATRCSSPCFDAVTGQRQ
jgi:hypothetical protein